MFRGGYAEFLKDALHGYAKHLVVLVQWLRILSLVRWPEFLGSSQQGFDRLVAEHDQRRDCLQALRDGFIPACLAHAADNLFATEFLQIVGSAARAILGFGVMAERSNFLGYLGSGEPTCMPREQ